MSGGANPDEEFDEAEIKRRAEQALRGAFKTPPQPLKERPAPPSREEKR